MGPEIKVLPDPAEIVREAAERFVAAANRIGRGTQFSVALAGGSTPKAMYELLATDRYGRRSIGATSRFLRRRAQRPARPQGQQLPHGRRGAAVARSRSPATTSTACAARSTRRGGQGIRPDVEGEVRRRRAWISCCWAWATTATPLSLFPGTAAWTSEAPRRRQLREPHRQELADHDDGAVHQPAPRDVIVLVAGAGKARPAEGGARRPARARTGCRSSSSSPPAGRLTWLVDAAAAGMAGAEQSDPARRLIPLGAPGSTPRHSPKSQLAKIGVPTRLSPCRRAGAPPGCHGPPVGQRISKDDCPKGRSRPPCRKPAHEDLRRSLGVLRRDVRPAGASGGSSGRSGT